MVGGESMKYKVGDKVKLKDKEGFDEIARKWGEVKFEPDAYELAGSDCTICNVTAGGYIFDNSPWCWSENMIEGLAEDLTHEEKPSEVPEAVILNGADVMRALKQFKVPSETIEQVKGDVERNYRKAIIEEQEKINEGMNKREQYGPTCSDMFETAKLHREKQSFTKAEIFGDVIFYPADSGERLELIRNKGYEFRDENGNVIEAEKIVLDKKKQKWPKSYEECCESLGLVGDFYIGYGNQKRYITRYESSFQDKLCNLGKLLICRDAYWKIAGEEMGLGKPWKPNWDKCNGIKYCIYPVLNGIRHDAMTEEEYENRVLAFPMREMRDAFYENFKELIEDCKELL